MKLPNSFGTCYRLPGNRRKPWIAREYKGRDEKGRSIYETIGYFESQSEALDAISLRRHNPITPKADMTLAEVYKEWSAKKYKEGKKKKGISKDTVNNYKAAWKYLQRYEKELFRELRSGHWQDIIDEQEEEEKSHSHMKKIKTLIGLLYKYGNKNGIIRDNLAEHIELPREEKGKKDRFTDPEVKKLEKAAVDKVPWADTVLILIYSGMRISEMLGLTRFNVDMDKQLITGGIKTDAGKDRIIPIHPKILPYIKKWYDREGEALICNDEGKRLSAKKYREDFYYPALDAAEVRKLTPHKCRHTFCSIAAEKGVDTIYIQQMAGHATYAFTADEYTHPDIEALKKAIRMM
ncbi:MAG: site-specific integrase [Thermodesulfobacteriota bacterium]|nr:site-specific integrase [Thermodesulfobacteriota bacterium]